MSKEQEKLIDPIFKKIDAALRETYDECQLKTLDLHFVFSFLVIDREKNKPVTNYTKAHGVKKNILRVLQGLKDNLEMEPGDFLNV